MGPTTTRKLTVTVTDAQLTGIECFLRSRRIPFSVEQAAPTGRAPSQPALQTLPPRTDAGKKIVSKFKYPRFHEREI